MRRATWATLLAVLLTCTPATAHEVRPAYLEVRQLASDSYQVRWKQPVVGDLALHLRPHLSNGWIDGPPDRVVSTSRYALSTWTIGSSRGDPMQAVVVSVEGLDTSVSDVLLDVSLRDGRAFRQILTPERHSIVVRFRTRDGLPVPAYLRLGVEHILTGADHLGFVLGLVLLVGFRKRLLGAVTAFTVAHSLTLAAAALGLVRVHPALIEALVALSVLFLAVEVVRGRRGQPGLTSRLPWLIAFCFGLLHGFAFAGALAEIGLPRGELPGALLLFNAGAEIGQLMFIAALGVVAAGLLTIRKRLSALRLEPLGALPAYAVGGFAGLWFIERTVVIFS